jgi:hypothetical protein
MSKDKYTEIFCNTEITKEAQNNPGLNFNLSETPCLLCKLNVSSYRSISLRQLPVPPQQVFPSEEGPTDKGRQRNLKPRRLREGRRPGTGTGRR